MTATITIEGKQLGSKKGLFPNYSLPYPPQWQTSNEPLALREPLTLRDLIGHIVIEEVSAFRKRQAERRLIRALTAEEISAEATAGKIDPGGRDLEQAVDDEVAVATALEAFEDGLYYVFINGSQQTELDSAITISPDSTVTFVRLVLLAGG